MLTFLSSSGGYKGRVAFTSSRAAAVLFAALVLLCAVAVAVGGRVSSASAQPQLTGRVYFDAGPVSGLREARILATAPSWRGGPTTTPTGEVVDIRVSDSLPLDVTPDYWAGFLSGLVHGSELSRLTMYVTTLDDVQAECGERALGCYGANQMIVPGEVTPDGTTPEEIVRHEYGHHIAYNRTNAPWSAVDWGPKNWASVESVCSRTAQQEAFPGDEGSNYQLNPGEAWAETYRLLVEQKAGITTNTWPIVDSSFYPSSAALVAAERDVVQPWTTSRTAVYSHRFAKKAKKPWWLALTTPLDGDFKVSATLPSGSEYSVVLVSSDRSKVLKRGQWVGQRVKSLTSTVCGQRALFVRVTPGTSPGAVGGLVRVSVTRP
jgi:hypothetical protein